MGVLLLMNVVLFVYTAYKIKRTQQDTANMVQHAGSKLRENKDRSVTKFYLNTFVGYAQVPIYRCLQYGVLKKRPHKQL